MGLWNRVFALAYDPFLARGEKRGIAAARRSLLVQARGRVLEVGAGTGLNVPHYPSDVEVVFTEPDPHMARRLRRTGVEVIEAGAEALPFPDDSFDTVVVTFVLCTVPDVPAALAEIRRVLRPDGSLLFLEHVRAAEGTRLAQWQDRLHGPWKAFACGCNCNLDTERLLADGGFDAAGTAHEWRFMPQIVRPVVAGIARPS